MNVSDNWRMLGVRLPVIPSQLAQLAAPGLLAVESQLQGAWSHLTCWGA